MNYELIERAHDAIEFWENKAKTVFGVVLNPKIVIINEVSPVAGRAHGSDKIELNYPYLESNTEVFLKSTIPHEIAHCIQHIIKPYAKQSHGPEWKNIMRCLGLVPTSCHSYDTLNILRTKKPYIYQCACRKVGLSAIRHKRSKRGKYTCSICKKELEFIGM